MVYLTGAIPVGIRYPDRLANLGLGHGAIDAGYGYTYFDPAAGNEFSVVAGMTYNFENPDTDYQNGIDGHLDFGVSKFLSEQVQVGAVGYLYQQLTGDSGDGRRSARSSRAWPASAPSSAISSRPGRMQGYVNLKGYYEFAAENRPEGWNVWLSVAFSPPVPEG